MRFNPIIKKIFSNDVSKIEIIKKDEFDKRIKTKKVLVDVEVITKALKFFISKGRIEGVCLLRGKISGEYLLISDIYCCTNALATPINVKIPLDDFTKAADIEDDNYICGWLHSHPGFDCYISGIDELTQKDFQALFPDAVAMVMNPFAKNKFEFKFFRYNKDLKLETLRYDFMVRGDEN